MHPVWNSFKGNIRNYDQNRSNTHFCDWINIKDLLEFLIVLEDLDSNKGTMIPTSVCRWLGDGRTSCQSAIDTSNAQFFIALLWNADMYYEATTGAKCGY